jgi:hypothetical protein
LNSRWFRDYLFTIVIDCRPNDVFKSSLFVSTVGYARTNVIGSIASFVLAYIEMYVFRGNPFQAHSLEHSYHPTQPLKHEKYNTKLKI